VVLQPLIAASLPVIEGAQIRLIAHTLEPLALPDSGRSTTKVSLQQAEAHQRSRSDNGS